ncbi:MAG: ABC transporter permease [Eubacteriales bacterium]
MMEKRLGNRLSKQGNLTLFMFILLMVIIVVVSIIQPKFLNTANIRNVINQQSILIMVGVTITFLLITGNFDLSVGGIIGASGVMCAFFCQSVSQGGAGFSFPVAIILALLIAVAIGAANAYIVVRLGVASVIATLGTMSIARGLAYIFAKGSMVELGLPADFRVFGSTDIGGFLSFPMLFMIITVLVFLFIQNKTVFGQRIYYIGANRKAALLSGIKVGRQISILYIISGALAGFAGILLASKLGAGDCKVGAGYEFDAVVAVVLGGTSILGGAGSVVGMVVGVFIIGILQNTMNLFGAAPDWQEIVKGIVIIAAILFQRLAHRWKA